MRKNRLTILLCSILSFVTSCDKVDCNGDLDGMWQMTEWWQTHDGQQEPVTFSNGLIYYSFQLSMIRVQRNYDQTKNSMILASFRKIGNQLKIYNPLTPAVNQHESYRDMKELAEFGVPESGIFNITLLTADRMVLVSDEKKDSLIFRKY